MLRATKIRSYVNSMKSRGFAASSVLEGSGITLKRLQDPSLLIDMEQAEVVIKNIYRLSGNPAIGFDIANDFELTDFGILAHAMMSSRTLREAIALWFRFNNLVGMTIQMTMEERGGEWTVFYDTLRTQGVVRCFAVEEMVIAGKKIGETLVGKVFTPKEFNLSYPPPEHAALYKKLLPCPVRFDARRTTLTISDPPLDTPLRGNDPEFHEICLRHCSQILRQISSSSPFAGQVRSLLMSQPGKFPSLSAAATHLGLSPSSLKRHLHTEGTSYQVIIDNFRLDLAKEYLTSELQTPKEIGYLLGFSNITAFRRAFKNWTGKTIQQFRDAL